MTVCEFVCVLQEKEWRKGRSDVNSLFCPRAGGAIDSGGNHITEETQGLAESSNENVFSLHVFVRSDSMSDFPVSVTTSICCRHIIEWKGFLIAPSGFWLCIYHHYSGGKVFL